MKKSYLLAGLLSFSMLLVGCGDKNEVVDPEVDPGFNGKMEELTPSKSKTRLQDVGLEFIDAIDAATHENLVDVVAYMEEELDYLDIDKNYLDKLEELATETGSHDDEYYARKYNPVSAIQGLMAMSLDAAQNGAQLATRADDIYMFTLKAGLKDLYGGFKPNMKYEEWVYDESITDRLEVEFTDDHNQTWVATLKGSKETTRVHLMVEDISKWKETNDYGWSDEPNVYEGGYHDKYDISIDVPKVITLVVRCNQEEIINLTANSSLALDVDVYEDYNRESFYGSDENGDWFYESKSESKFDLEVDYTNLNLDASLNVNGYAETWKTEANKAGITSVAEVKIDGKSMLKAEASLAADVDALIKQINEVNNYSDSYSSKDDNDEYEEDEDFYFLKNTIKNFAMKLDIMGKAQVYGKCDSFEKMYEALIDDDKYYDYETDEFDFKEYAKYVDRINDTYSITVHYDNTKTVQANVEFEAYQWEEDYWGDSYTYHDIRPVLIFAADDSRYCFEDYFTETSFSKLIDAVKELADEFEKMVEDAYN